MSIGKRVAVIGGGVIGTSCALKSLEACPDLEVHLIAEKFSPDTTGDGSAGFWCPYLLGETLPSTMRFWCQETFNFLKAIHLSSEASNYGVGLLSAYKVSQSAMEEPIYSDIFLQWRKLNQKELDLFPSRFRYGIFVTTLYAECTKLIPKLMKKFQSKGGKIIKARVNSIKELSGKYDAVINCTGVEAATFVPDPSVHPIRGQVIRVRAPWIKHAVLAEDDFYILPNSEEVICGGTHQEGDWNTQVDPKDRKRIWKGCVELVPSLQNAEILREWVGLRPGRSKPRLEREALITENGILEIIHNYGHGGSGVTLFWGCALHAVNLLKEALIAKQNPSSL